MVARDVGVCGIGVVSGYGWSRESLWDGLVSGKPAAEVVPGLGRFPGDTVWAARVGEGGFRETCGHPDRMN